MVQFGVGDYDQTFSAGQGNEVRVKLVNGDTYRAQWLYLNPKARPPHENYVN